MLLNVFLLAVGALVLVGCTGEITEEVPTGGEYSGLRGGTPGSSDGALHTTASAGDAAEVAFTEGSGSPIPGVTRADQDTLGAGCIGAAADVAVGFAGGPLDSRGLIQRENYSTLEGGGTLTASWTVCDVAGTLAHVRWWSEIAGNGARNLQITLTSPRGEASSLESEISDCHGNPCSIFSTEVTAEAAGRWTLTVENTGRSKVQIAQFMQYIEGGASDAPAPDPSVTYQRLTPADDSLYSGLGFHLDMTDAVLVATDYDGRIYTYRRDETGWADASVIQGTTGDVVPTLSADGMLLVTGDWWTGSRAGIVQVFHASEGGWALAHDLAPSNGETGDGFGYDVDLSSDGHWLIAGSRYEDGDATSPSSNAATDSGAAYIYRWDGTGFVEEAYLKATNAEAEDYFGVSVAISDDGTVAVVGATGEDSDLASPDNDNLPSSGAAYVFRRVDGAWQQEGLLKGSQAAAGDWAGWNVGISGDGATVLVAGYGGSEGPVYVFQHDGSSWTEEARLVGSNTEDADWYGRSAALSADGNSVLVGAPFEQGDGVDPADNSVEYAGAAYLFQRTDGGWDGGTYLKSPSVTSGEQFALQVALSPDGSRHALGSTYGADDRGVVYVVQ